MTAREAFDLITQGGVEDLARTFAACESAGSYCLIGGLAVSCYVEPVYDFDIEIVLRAPPPTPAPQSKLRIQFTTDERYQPFLARSTEAEVLGLRVKVACLEDVTQGKLWAYGDPQRRLSKRKKDELDLVRLAEAHPELRFRYPTELRAQIDRG